MLRPNQAYRGRTAVDRSIAQGVMDALAEPMAILNQRGEIIAANRAWRSLAQHNLGDGSSASNENSLDVHQQDAFAGNMRTLQALAGMLSTLNESVMIWTAGMDNEPTCFNQAWTDYVGSSAERQLGGMGASRRLGSVLARSCYGRSIPRSVRVGIPAASARRPVPLDRRAWAAALS